MSSVQIIVCIKQVPETTEIQIDHNTGTLQREDVEGVINPLDMYALEEGIRLKEKLGGRVAVLSMGPLQAERSLREALALGCDEAYLMTDKVFAGADTLATAYTLACGVRRMDCYDIILCGVKTTDGDTAQVGPGLAEELNIPHVSYVRKIIGAKGDKLNVERSVEDSYEEIEVLLPCLITVTKEINVPRLPSFRTKMQARKMPVTIWNAQDLSHVEMKRFGLDGSPTRVIKVAPPPPRRKGEILVGDPKSQALTLIRRLKEKHML